MEMCGNNTPVAKGTQPPSEIHPTAMEALPDIFSHSNVRKSPKSERQLCATRRPKRWRTARRHCISPRCRRTESRERSWRCGNRCPRRQKPPPSEHNHDQEDVSRIVGMRILHGKDCCVALDELGPNWYVYSVTVHRRKDRRRYWRPLQAHRK